MRKKEKETAARGTKGTKREPLDKGKRERRRKKEKGWKKRKARGREERALS